jgi:hypothetical protein
MAEHWGKTLLLYAEYMLGPERSREAQKVADTAFSICLIALEREGVGDGTRDAIVEVLGPVLIKIARSLIHGARRPNLSISELIGWLIRGRLDFAAMVEAIIEEARRGIRRRLS